MSLKEYTITLDEPINHNNPMNNGIKTIKSITSDLPSSDDFFTYFGPVWVATRFIRAVQIQEIK